MCKWNDAFVSTEWHIIPTCKNIILTDNKYKFQLDDQLKWTKIRVEMVSLLNNDTNVMSIIITLILRLLKTPN